MSIKLMDLADFLWGLTLISEMLEILNIVQKNRFWIKKKRRLQNYAISRTFSCENTPLRTNSSFQNIFGLFIRNPEMLRDNIF